MRININSAANNAHRNLLQTSTTQQKTLEKLASGLKINRGADAPAQLQISEHLTPGFINSKPILWTFTFASQAFKESSSAESKNKVLSSAV